MSHVHPSDAEAAKEMMQVQLRAPRVFETVHHLAVCEQGTGAS